MSLETVFVDVMPLRSAAVETVLAPLLQDCSTVVESSLRHV